jgi:arylsulfatase A-like enzyme
VPKPYYDKFPLERIELPPYREDDLKDLPAAAVRMALSSGDHEAILKQGGTNAWKQAIRAYLAAINFCDTMVGRLLDAFDKSPARDNTLICFWSDHGWHLGEKHHWRKFALWEESTRAPFVWVVPGLTKPNSRCDRTVDFMSIYPTLMDLAGLPIPSHVQGKSLRPLLAAPEAPWDQPALTTYRFMNHSVRSEDWRYTRYADGGEELYDHRRDPFEWSNLAGQSAEFDSTKASLAKHLPTENKPAAKTPSNQAAPGKAAKRKKNTKP